MTSVCPEPVKPSCPDSEILPHSLKLILSVPVFDHDGQNAYHYNRVITIRIANHGDRADALTGAEVKEPIEVQENMPNAK
jgi:hypothetical protein